MSSSPFVLSVRSGQAPAQETILKMGLKSFWPLVSSSHFAFEGSLLCSSGFWISPPLLSCLSPFYKETNGIFGYGWFLDKKDRKDRNPHPSRSPHLGEGLLHLVHVQPLAHHLTLGDRSKKTPPTIIGNQHTSSLILSTEKVWLVEEVSSTPEPLLRRRKQSTWQLLVWDQTWKKKIHLAIWNWTRKYELNSCNNCNWTHRQEHVFPVFQQCPCLVQLGGKMTIKHVVSIFKK